jgi:hypothetical protein
MITTPSINPLANHFRQPAIHLRLPSGGNNWPTGSLDMPETGELPVYPMTAKDELVLKTPDALMNGDGVVSVIQSCIPSIKSAWLIPICDLDPILIAIRLTSYGNDMEISSLCPKCNETNENLVDLGQLLDTLPPPLYPDLTHEKLTFKFKPQSFQSLNSINQAKFEQQSLLRTISSSEVSDDQKQSEFKKLLPKITELTVQALIDGIESIVVDDVVVSNTAHVREFIDNCDRKTYETLKSHVEKIGLANKTQDLEIECTECKEPYKTELAFENSNFFV